MITESGATHPEMWAEALKQRANRRAQNLAYIEAKLADSTIPIHQRFSLVHEQKLLLTYRARHPRRAEFRFGLV